MNTAEANAHSLADQIVICDQARQRGLAFLHAHINQDGSLPLDPHRVSCYRVPWALAIGGKAVAASRVLAWIHRTGIGARGDFHGGLPWSASANATFNTYPETCLAFGAHVMRRFDVAQRAMRFALDFQDRETGGVFMDRERTGDDGPQLLFLTCQFGMSALITGHLDAAQATGAWLQRLWNAQPELPHRLYTVWTRREGLITTPPEREDARHYINESQEVRQLHYNGGIAAAFLAQLYMHTQDAQWRDLAEAFQAFSMNSTERQFETKQVCKSAWGASLLAIATSDQRYIDWASRMGDWFVSGQEPDGHWDNTSYLDPDSPLEHQIEVTAEFVIHLDAVVCALASADTAAQLSGVAAR